MSAPAMSAALAAQRRLLVGHGGFPGMGRRQLERALAVQMTLSLALWSILSGELPADPQSIEQMDEEAFRQAVMEATARGTASCQ